MVRIEEAALKFFRQNFPAKQVRISDLKNYLKDKGWIEVSKNDVTTKFKSPTYNIFVFVPEQDDLEDYERAVEIVIEAFLRLKVENLKMFLRIYNKMILKLMAWHGSVAPCLV